MVGSGSADRSKDAVGMMALHEALRTVCLNSDWTYSVFWTIRPRPRVRGGNGCKVGDDNGSLMLMWEDGFCKGRVADCLEEIDGEDPVRKAFSKMSIQLYNYGEGLMGKVASDKCHKWVFKEPTECEPNISNYWQSSFDALPPEWTDQFDSGIQTIAVIQAGHGLLQLGSCKIIPEDLHFVLRMRHTFESLGYQSGFYLSQLFSLNRNGSSKQSTVPTLPPPPLFNWSQRPLPTATNPTLASPNFQNPARLGFQQPKDETHMFLLPRSSETRMEDMMVEHENDIKWPNGLSFFSALTGRTEDAKFLFNSESLGNKPETNHHPQILEGKDSNQNSDSLDSHPVNMRKMDKLKNFTIPARMATSSSSTSVEHHQHQPGEYRNSEPGMYTDVMETFLE
ncbi:putative galactinol--sucrose galactosyltransferase 1-like [Hibiscus syriacus]|uniref:Galactinol--sucrose galactosyltransferase 1-like n=1 Tax=Hibiscus syriacus TaxID=106335 RepID=A0A6A2ZL24_HIBSY|nr:protein RICE SALT SENSITIVE 3-like [Hibiscus syriacus]KAE8692276.1 putative galactinol--sucrose galactosyltransferase 1-like [Hibiscus syriacus]